MPDYYSKYTVSPSEIPHDLITPEIKERLVSSGGRITEMTIEGASAASRLVVDSQGGFALFITADEIKSINTGLWLSQQKDPNAH